MPTGSHSFENQKKMLLENEVASVITLRAIKDQADQCLSYGGQELTYDQY